ncbi:MAG TPA: hypothetical protein VI141_02645 [Acidimicrobiia bacterium]
MSVIVDGSPAVIETDPSAPPRHVLVLSVALGVVAASVAALTFYLPDVLTGPAVTNGNARGTALVMLYGAVPVLLVSTFLASRGSWRAVMFWLGSMFYLAYNAFLLLFLTPINQLFLGYVATQSLAVFAIFTLYSALDDDWLVAQMRPPPRRALAVLVWAIVGLNAMAWLGAIVPALMSDPSTLVTGTGVATNAIYVQDLVFWLPMMALAAWWLWHGRPSGILLTGSWLLFGVIESVGVAVDQWFGHQADPTSTWASVEIIPFFFGLAVVNAAAVLFYMRSRPESTG